MGGWPAPRRALRGRPHHLSQTWLSAVSALEPKGPEASRVEVGDHPPPAPRRPLSRCAQPAAQPPLQHPAPLPLVVGDHPAAGGSEGVRPRKG